MEARIAQSASKRHTMTEDHRSSEAEGILERAAAGERISEEECLALFGFNDLPRLGAVAHRIRLRKAPPEIVTYVVDRNINYTNICISGCAFCAFYREPGSPEGYVLSPEEVLAKVAEAVEAGATQILMQGGLHPTFGLEEMERTLSAVKERFPVHLHSLSPPEVVHLARISGLGWEEVLLRLRKAGLDSLPGGGAEILCAEVREEVSPRKATADEWVGVMRAAHRLGMSTTATMMFGHVETSAQRMEHLSLLRRLQDETGGFRAFIPWTYQSENTRLGGSPVGGHEYLKTLAISRLFLDNFDNLQASWVTQGLAMAQVALFFGANDLGGTMMEENVVSAAGASFRASEEEVRRAIKGAGFRPVKRNTLYEYPDA